MKTLEKLPQTKEMTHSCFQSVRLSKQQAPDSDPKVIQQINFTRNLERAGNTAMFFIIKEVNKTILEFSQGNAKVL